MPGASLKRAGAPLPSKPKKRKKRAVSAAPPPRWQWRRKAGGDATWHNFSTESTRALDEAWNVGDLSTSFEQRTETEKQMVTMDFHDLQFIAKKTDIIYQVKRRNTSGEVDHDYSEEWGGDYVKEEDDERPRLAAPNLETAEGKVVPVVLDSTGDPPAPFVPRRRPTPVKPKKKLPKSFMIGDNVRIKGLRARPDYNGKLAKVISDISTEGANKGRYQVEIHMGKGKATQKARLKPANLEPYEPEVAPEPGSVIRLSKGDFKGYYGVVKKAVVKDKKTNSGEIVKVTNYGVHIYCGDTEPKKKVCGRSWFKIKRNMVLKEVSGWDVSQVSERIRKAGLGDVGGKILSAGMNGCMLLSLVHEAQLERIGIKVGHQSSAREIKAIQKFISKFTRGT